MKTFIKYFLVSAVALVLDYITYWVLFSIWGVSLPLAASIGYTLGLLFAYYWMRCFVFKGGWLKDRKLFEFLTFILSGGLGVALTYITVLAVIGLIGNEPLVAKSVAVTTSFFGVYLFRKLYVFRM